MIDSTLSGNGAGMETSTAWLGTSKQVGLWAVVFLAACNARVSLGDLGESSAGSPGDKPSVKPPAAEAGAPAEAPTGGTGAGGAGLAGPDTEAAGQGPAAGGSGDTNGGSGGSGSNPVEPYAPRSGPFKMVVYSKTAAFRHDGSIQTGRLMLQQIANEQGFELVITEQNDFLADLASVELVFFLNSTGDVFTDQEQQIYEQWMTRGGAFAGTHSATDTENGWAFYSEVTGQYYDGHGAAGTVTSLELVPEAHEHVTVKGLPDPWQRTGEWMKFNSHAAWSTKPGFQILMRNSADGHPVSWLREWGNFRAFYTSIGHGLEDFQDPLIKKHLTGGIMWAVRRDHLLE